MAQDISKEIKLSPFCELVESVISEIKKEAKNEKSR